MMISAQNKENHWTKWKPPSYNVQISSWFQLCSISLISAYFCMSWVEASDNFKKKQSPALMFNKVPGFNCVRSHWDQPIFAWVELKPQISSKIIKLSYNVQKSSLFQLCSISLRSAQFCMSWDVLNTY